MRPILASQDVLTKLKDKHDLTLRHVEHCFENKLGIFLEDTREGNRTDPPSLWFVAPTNCERVLKVVFMFIDGNIHLKTAYDAEPEAIEIYNRHGR